MTRSRTVSVLVLCLVLMLLAVPLQGCGLGSKPEAQEIWFGAVGDLTGPAADIGRYAQCGVDLAVEEINAAGGVNGKMLRVIHEDDRLDPKEAVVIAQKLADDSKVVAVIGYTSSTAGLAAVPIHSKAGQLQLSWGNTSPELSGHDVFYRICPTDAVFGRQLGQYAAQKMGKQRIAIMVTQSDGPIANAEAFRKGAEESGATVVAWETHTDETKDYLATLTKIQELDPDLIFTSTWYTNAALMARQARELGITAEFMGMDATYSPELTTLGEDAVEGYWAGGFFHPDQSEQAKKYAADYEKKCGFEPESFGTNAYDAVYLLKEALEKGGETRQEVLDYMATVDATNPFEGVAGVVIFDPYHDPLKSAVVCKIENGRWVFKDTLEAAQ